MAKLILCACVVSLICAALAQDFEPPLLEGSKTTTLEPPTTTTTVGTTEIPVQSTDAPSTAIPSTTTIATTTMAATEIVTDSPFPTTQKPTTTTTTPKTTTTPRTTTTTSRRTTTTPRTTTTTPRTTTSTRKPASWYPNNPSFNNNLCYYKTQQGFPQLVWKCGRLEVKTTTECFRCCLYTNSYFAGCYKVSSHFCPQNDIKDDFDFSYF